MKPNMFEMARESGLPVSWWQKAIDEGETREWRELKKFAELIARECLSYTKSGDIDFVEFMIKRNFGIDQ